MIAYTTATAIFWLVMGLIVIPIVRWLQHRHRTRDIRRTLSGKPRH